MAEEEALELYNILKGGKLFSFKDADDWLNDNDFPQNGIYLMIENTEKGRVSRVGINITQILKKRLRDHFNKGLHNSVLRRHLFEVIGSEKGVSEYIKDNIKFYVISSDSQNRRIQLEAKLISTLSCFPVKNISNRWLGSQSSNNIIFKSGLWNVQHVFGQGYLSKADLSYIRKNLK